MTPEDYKKQIDAYQAQIAPVLKVIADTQKRLDQVGVFKVIAKQAQEQAEIVKRITESHNFQYIIDSQKQIHAMIKATQTDHVQIRLQVIQNILGSLSSLERMPFSGSVGYAIEQELPEIKKKVADKPDMNPQKQGVTKYENQLKNESKIDIFIKDQKFLKIIFNNGNIVEKEIPSEHAYTLLKFFSYSDDSGLGCSPELIANNTMYKNKSNVARKGIPLLRRFFRDKYDLHDVIQTSESGDGYFVNPKYRIIHP